MDSLPENLPLDTGLEPSWGRHHPINNAPESSHEASERLTGREPPTPRRRGRQVPGRLVGSSEEDTAAREVRDCVLRLHSQEETGPCLEPGAVGFPRSGTRMHPPWF